MATTSHQRPDIAANAAGLRPDNAISAEPCRLLNLPAELRSLIYTFALQAERINIVERGPALLRVSRQVRSEAGSLYRGVNTFLCFLQRNGRLVKCLARLGPHARHARSFLLISPYHTFGVRRPLGGADWIVLQRMPISSSAHNSAAVEAVRGCSRGRLRWSGGAVACGLPVNK